MLYTFLLLEKERKNECVNQIWEDLEAQSSSVLHDWGQIKAVKPLLSFESCPENTFLPFKKSLLIASILQSTSFTKDFGILYMKHW